MDLRWFLIVYVLLLMMWFGCVALYTRRKPVETFSDGTCKFIGSENARSSCPAHLPRAMASLGHMGAQLRCDASGDRASKSRGVAAQAAAEVSKGRLTRVRVVFPGAGYVAAPSVRLHGGTGNGAEVQAVVDHGQVVEVRILKPGYGYLAQPFVEIEPPSPTFSFCHLCCAPDPLRKDLRDLRDRYDTLERILLEADPEANQRAASLQTLGTASAGATRGVGVTSAVAEANVGLLSGSGGIDPAELIARGELASEFERRLKEYLAERSEEIQKANEFLQVIEKQFSREEEMKRLNEVYNLNTFKPMYTQEYVEKIKWVADTERRVKQFLETASEKQKAACAQRWKSYTTPPSDLRPFEQQCGAFPLPGGQLPVTQEEAEGEVASAPIATKEEPKSEEDSE